MSRSPISAVASGLALFAGGMILIGCSNGAKPSSPVIVPPPPSEFVGDWSISDTLYTCKPFSPAFPKRQWSATICSEDTCLLSHIVERVGQRTTYFTGDLYPFTLNIDRIEVTDSHIAMSASGETIFSEDCHVQMAVVSDAVRHGDSWIVTDKVTRTTVGPNCDVPVGSEATTCFVFRSAFTRP